MSIERLKELRDELHRNNPPTKVLATVGDVIQLIDILIESPAGASDRTQPVAELIELTRGQYNHELLVKYMEGK